MLNTAVQTAQPSPENQEKQGHPSPKQVWESAVIIQKPGRLQQAERRLGPACKVQKKKKKGDVNTTYKRHWCISTVVYFKLKL